jgi:hypothetical protein
MVIADSKVVQSSRNTFGGTRIKGGQVSVDLWSDGVVLGAAWSVSQPELGGQLFSFRGSVKRVQWAPRSQGWRLVDAAGVFIGAYPTRADVLDKVERLCVMDAFRELNRVQRDR